MTPFIKGIRDNVGQVLLVEVELERARRGFGIHAVFLQGVDIVVEQALLLVPVFSPFCGGGGGVDVLEMVREHPDLPRLAPMSTYLVRRSSGLHPVAPASRISLFASSLFSRRLLFHRALLIFLILGLSRS